MPYIITTTRTIQGGYTVPGEREFIIETSRHAVATLEEARAQIRTDLCDWHGATGPDDPAVVAALDLSEASGGTIGPLPDGTVIEVARVEWLDFTCEALAIGVPAETKVGSALLDAYNARS